MPQSKFNGVTGLPGIAINVESLTFRSIIPSDTSELVYYKMTTSVTETYQRYLEKKNPGNNSSVTGDLIVNLLKIYSVPHISEINSPMSISDILEHISPISAGAANLTAFVAFYVKVVISHSYEMKSWNTQANINRILELIFYSNDCSNCSAKANASYVLSHYQELGGVEGFVHTVIVAYTFLVNEADVVEAYRLGISKVCCRILADIQALNRKSFLKCLRCFLLWYFDDGLCRSDLITLYRQYFDESSDLLTQSSLKETINIVIDVVGEELMRNSKSMSKLFSESLVAKVFDLMPLKLAIEVIVESFLSSSNSRNRTIAVDFVDTVIRIICSRKKSTTDEPDGLIKDLHTSILSSQYYKPILKSVEEMISEIDLQNNPAIHTKLCNEDIRISRSTRVDEGLQEILDRCLFLLTDSGKHE